VESERRDRIPGEEPLAGSLVDIEVRVSDDGVEHVRMRVVNGGDAALVVVAQVFVDELPGDDRLSAVLGRVELLLACLRRTAAVVTSKT